MNNLLLKNGQYAEQKLTRHIIFNEERRKKWVLYQE